MAKTKTEPKFEAILRFPNQATLDAFLGWFSDGGGEYQMMEASEEWDRDYSTEIDHCEYNGNIITCTRDPNREIGTKDD